MTKPRKVSPIDPVKPFFGVLYKEAAVLVAAIERISLDLNPVDFHSGEFAFEMTDYYAQEMGSGLIRTFIACENFIDPQELIHYKHYAFDLENEFSCNKKRTINLDPGYLNYHQVVLSSAKCLPHKIYMGEGVYAEVEMIYKGNTYNPQPWSYADYSQHVEIFHELRNLYAQQYKTRQMKPIPSSFSKKVVI